MQVEILFHIMRDGLCDDVTVRTARRMMSAPDELIEQRACVGEVEISRQEQGPVETARFVHEGMAG